MDQVDAEYYAGGLRELAQDMTNAPDKHEIEYLNAAASFIERQQAEIEALKHEIERLEVALQSIADQEPNTADMTLAHAMAQEARAALTNGKL